MSGMPVMNDRIARTLEALSAPDFLSVFCGRMLGATGEYESWGSICRSMDIPQGKVMEWFRADIARETAFHRALQLQRELRADNAADEMDKIVGIADATGPDEVAVSKLRVSARKDAAEFRTALAAVMTPERYGRVRAVVDAPSVVPDAALVGVARELLLRLVPSAQPVARDITGESRVVADPLAEQAHDQRVMNGESVVVDEGPVL